MHHLSVVEIMKIAVHLDAIEHTLSEFDAGIGSVAANRGTHTRGMDAVHRIRAIVKTHKAGRPRRGIINLEVEARRKSQAKFEEMKATSKRKSVSRYKAQLHHGSYYTTGPT